MIESKSRIRVRYAETDKMGVVYHANYFAWFEVARIEMLDALGVPYKGLEDEGYLLPVIEANAHYLQPARFDDVLEVRCRIASLPRLKIHIDYEVYRGEDLLATGHTLHAFVNEKGKVLKPPARLMEAMAAYFPAQKQE